MPPDIDKQLDQLFKPFLMEEKLRMGRLDRIFPVMHPLVCRPILHGLQFVHAHICMIFKY
ncbi:MAG: hypothetical protein DRN57_06005 [Thermoplasmata archaeon]|nr:MAG: hypothetical protein DRN57_06005 [Thermoplasmata archaeon]